MPCWPGKKKKLESSTKSSLVLVNEVTSGFPKKSSAFATRNSLLKLFSIRSPTETSKALQDIFSYLPINNILQARQVCKLWNTAACHVLRRRIEGAIILQRGLSYYTQVMSKSLEIPIGRLFLKIDDMHDPAAGKFFQVVGPGTIFLVLNLEGSSLAGLLPQIHHLQNLEQLTLNLFKEDVEGDDNFRRRKATTVKILIDDYDSNSNSNSNAFSWKKLYKLESFVLSCEPEWKTNEALLLEKILEMSPNLKTLNLQKWPFPLKPSLFQKCEFENIRFLSLRSLDDQGFLILGKKTLPKLKTVEVELSRDVSQDSLQTFFENVASTLEYIEMKSTTNPGINFKISIVMKELNTIRLPTWVGVVMLDSIITNVPKLEKLQLSNVNPSDIHVKDQVRQALRVEYLAINFGNGDHSIKTVFKTLKNFVLAFPNLKVFMMKKVSDKGLEMICEGWPRLEALRITTSFALSDSGITGLPASLLQKAQKTEYKLSCGCCIPFPVIDGRPECTASRITPHIAMLKNLKDLRIEAEQGTHWTLTNLSLHLGLSELRKLTSLRLTCHELGPHWCLRNLADNLPYLHHLTIMDRTLTLDRYDEQELQYLLRRLPNLNLTFAEADSYSAKRLSKWHYKSLKTLHFRLPKRLPLIKWCQFSLEHHPSSFNMLPFLSCPTLVQFTFDPSSGFSPYMRPAGVKKSKRFQRFLPIPSSSL